MTAAEVGFLLDTLAGVVDAQPAAHPLRRVDRDNSRILDGPGAPRFSEAGETTEANLVTLALDGRETEPVGGEYDHRVETTVGVRVVGDHHTQHGHIDPTDERGVAFDALLRQIQGAITDERSYPSGAEPTTAFTYCSLFVENESNQAALYRDGYQADFDVRFRGFEAL